ncbi:MAG: PBP1A family penicillin-binding protein [Ruminococcaceae bacterium]|nr:PBP1A family penicillin-binding protein [Oscillospiraceae bacterium]
MKRARNNKLSEKRPVSGSEHSHASNRIQQRRDDRARANKNKKKANKKRFVYKLKIAIAILITLGVLACIGIGAGMYAAISQEMSEYDFFGIAHNFSSTIFANDSAGNSIEVVTLQSDGNREWIETDKIPQVVKDAAVAIEDERFYTHHGVDIKRTAGAVVGWISAKVTGGSPSYGGSTITQQVIKNITNEKDKTAIRKIKEMMRAVAFEKQFTKDEIITMYLNIAYFGNNCYGIEASSKMYFGKPALDLTAKEAAMIIGITQAPTRFDPYKNPENCTQKRNLVLSKMLEHGMIDQEEYETSIAADLGVRKKTSVHASIYSYFVDQVINDVIEDLQKEKGYSQTFASQQVFGGGLRIYATIDPDVQAAMESVYTEKSNFPASSRGTQSAMTIIDPYTGQIKGIVGGVGPKTESRGLNRATQSARQPGSSIKPISVYAPALETGKITSATILADTPLKIDKWAPKNSYSGFKGNMSVSKAIEISANIPAVKTLQTVGVDKSFDFMKNKYHFSTLHENDKNLSALGLGGMTKGVSTAEMAAAYSVFPNSGIYIEPHTYTKVLDNSGKVLLEKEPITNRVLSEANAFIMISYLKNVVNGASGTGRNARLSKFTAYGKTGTTNDNCDKWFVGFTPYYVGAVWFGMDTMKPLTSVGVSNNVSTQVWKKVMEKIHANLPEKTFEAPSSVTAVAICQSTGRLAACRNSRSEYFANGTVPTKNCRSTSHASGAVSGSSKPATQAPAEEEPAAPSSNSGSVTDPSTPTLSPYVPTTEPTQATPAPTPDASAPNTGIIQPQTPAVTPAPVQDTPITPPAQEVPPAQQSQPVQETPVQQVPVDVPMIG